MHEQQNIFDQQSMREDVDLITREKESDTEVHTSDYAIEGDFDPDI